MFRQHQPQFLVVVLLVLLLVTFSFADTAYAICQILAVPHWAYTPGIGRFIARANTCYSHDANVNRSITGHELGHGGGLGHLCSSEGMALMGWNPNPESMYRPQATDERYAHDIYHMGQ